MSFLQLGYTMYRRRRLVVGLWIVLALLSLPLAPRAAGVLDVGGFSNESMEASQALTTLQRNLDFKATALSVIFTSDQWTVDDPRFAATADEALRDLRTMPQVADVVPYALNPRQVAADRRTAYTLITRVYSE